MKEAKRNGNITEKSSQSLVTIHQQFFDRLHRHQSSSVPVNASLEDAVKTTKLEKVKRQRRALSAEVHALNEYSNGSTVGELLRKRRYEMAEIQSRPYLQGLYDSKFFESCKLQRQQANMLEEKSVSSKKSIGEQRRSNQSLPQQVQEYRNQMKIRAAYQLLGTTLVYPCYIYNSEIDGDNLLVLRIDISVEGRYEACHHIFFELVTLVPSNRISPRRTSSESSLQSNTELLQLQVKQHTLPRVISNMGVLQQYLGSSQALGPWPADSIDFDLVTKRLQACSEQLHRLCTAYALRSRAVHFLQQIITSDVRPRDFRVAQLTTDVAHESIAFVLRLDKAGAEDLAVALHVQLIYQDLCESLPSDVKVRSTHQSIRNRMNNAPEARQAILRDVSSDEEGSNEENPLVQFAKMTFTKHAVPKAVETIVAHNHAVCAGDV